VPVARRDPNTEARLRSSVATIARGGVGDGLAGERFVEEHEYRVSQTSISSISLGARHFGIVLTARRQSPTRPRGRQPVSDIGGASCRRLRIGILAGALVPRELGRTISTLGVKTARCGERSWAVGAIQRPVRSKTSTAAPGHGDGAAT